MIRTPPPLGGAAAKARPKPKPKKPSDADGNDVDKQKAKRRRAAQKKRDADDAESVGQASSAPTRHHGAAGVETPLYEQRELLDSPDRLRYFQTAHIDGLYARAPRELPIDIPGVRNLTQTEIQSDLKRIRQAMAAFETRAAVLLAGTSANMSSVGRGDRQATLATAGESDDDDLAGMPYMNMLRDRRLQRGSAPVTPEEVVESVPAARRAVKITERELRALKRERDDLERDFMRMRTTFVWQVGEMKRMQKQQDRVMRVLSRDVIDKAKSLESSRRRTSALQDIMNELEARGSAMMRLTREKNQLEALLRKHDIELPEIDEVYVGDRVRCATFGHGKVAELDDDARIVVVDLDNGGRAYVQEDEVEVLASEITYLEAEQELKQKFFEKIGLLVRPNGKFSMLGSSRSSGRTRGRRVSEVSDSDDDMRSTDSDDEESSDEDNDGDEDDGPNEETTDASQKSRRRDNTSQNDVVEHLKKKRKLIMNPSTSTKKKAKNHKFINFPATTLPITPYEKGLLVSPLSTLPERVAAIGPNALQWLPSYLPKNMHEWEQERLESLQMKGEIERLRFQLQKAEADKLDAQQHASDQLESINQLVVQLEKLRESHGLSSNAGAGSGSSPSPSNESTNVKGSCPNCAGNSSNNVAGTPSKKHSAASAKSAKANAKSSTSRKESVKRTLDADGDGSDSDGASRSAIHDDDADAMEGTKGKIHDEAEDDGGDDSSDAATSAARPTRSLRPRRKIAASK